MMEFEKYFRMSVKSLIDARPLQNKCQVTIDIEFQPFIAKTKTGLNQIIMRP